MVSDNTLVVFWPTKGGFRCKEAVSLGSFVDMAGFGTGFFCGVMKSAFFCVFTCIFVLGGAIVGIISGAIKGQTTETGFCRGAGIGVAAGAITAFQLLESIVNGESLSKVALLRSLMNGKVFAEWVSPAVLKAYQWQITTHDTIYREISNMYDASEEFEMKGLLEIDIQKLPQHIIHSTEVTEQCDFCCTICIQDFMGGEFARRLPTCRHLFHLDCIDKWLTRQGSCPVCRENVSKFLELNK